MTERPAPPSFEAAHALVQDLCAEGRAEEALHLASSYDGHPLEQDQLKAMAELDAGFALGAPAVVREGIARFERLDEAFPNEPFGYNRANGHLAVWDLAVAEHGRAEALLSHRDDLHRARDLYAAVGADESQKDDLRCQALTNRGNSLDSCGRHAEALAAYDEALLIEPKFGMALGNRGLTLMWRAAVDDVHRHALGSEAVASLDAALSVGDDVLAHGGSTALQSFKRQRALIPGTPTHRHDDAPLPDRYLEWCRRHELFLHSSHRCITPRTKALDALQLGGLYVGIDAAAQQWLRTLQDALNSLVQDLVSVRYLTWMAVEPETPVRRHAAELSAHVAFADTLTYARWGVGTGLAVTALAAATNLLDKVASVTHLYLSTGRKPSSVYFRAFYLSPRKKGVPEQLDAAIASEIEADNVGLFALSDLAGELERTTPLNDLIRRRHAATHRTVAVHHMLVGDQDDAGWLDRMSYDALRDALLAQLARARAAIIYLTDLIRAREQRRKPDGPLPELPGWPASPERADDW